MFATIIWSCLILVCATEQSVGREDDIKQLVQELHEINFKMDTKLSEQMKDFLHAVNMVQQEMDTNFETIFQKQQKDFNEFNDNIKNELARQITKNENWKSVINLKLEKQDTQRQIELKELREETRNNMEQQRTHAEIMQKELKYELGLIKGKTLEMKDYSIEKFHMLDEQAKESKLQMEAMKNILQDQGKESKLQIEAMKINIQDFLGKELKLQVEAMKNILQDQGKESKLQLEDMKNKLIEHGSGSKLQLEAIQKNLLDLQTQQQIYQQTSLSNLMTEVHKDYSELQVLYNNTRTYPTTCAQALHGGGTSGVYKLQIPQLNTEPFSVYCEEDPAGGAAWTIIQRRQDGSVDFYRDWSEYKKGFGNLNGEYFIGLDLLHSMTTATKNELWFELRDFENVTKYAKYASFGIGNENEAFILNELGAYNGDAGDSFSYQKGAKFSTKDVDNDIHNGSCAVQYTGAWWYQACYLSSLNGRYLNGSYSKDLYGQGVTWNRWHGEIYSLKYTHMAIRPAKLQ